MENVRIYDFITRMDFAYADKAAMKRITSLAIAIFVMVVTTTVSATPTTPVKFDTSKMTKYCLGWIKANNEINLHFPC